MVISSATIPFDLWRAYCTGTKQTRQLLSRIYILMVMHIRTMGEKRKIIQVVIDLDIAVLLLSRELTSDSVVRSRPL